jgi:hypothetical protein
MGRFSRVKGDRGKKSEAPDLEAHFPDGAWYDIVLCAADPSRDRFLVQARDFPEEEEWLEADKVRLQSQPFEDPPKEGSLVLALHRAPRSDLFFEGFVTDIGPSSCCKVKFTEGRAKGHTVKCELDDVNKINSKKCTPEELRRWCPRKETAQQKGGDPKAAGGGQVVSFASGEFVLIEGPDDSCWVAQLLEPYTGKLSEEVDDVDDDGPRISLRWLYTTDELPSNLLKGSTVDNDHEVFLSFHKDTIDARLIKGKCACVFGMKRPKTTFKWKKDTMFSCRTWDPVKKKISGLDCPLLSTEFRTEIDRLIKTYPYPEGCRSEKDKDNDSRTANVGAASGAETAPATTDGEKTPRLRDGSRRHSDEGNHSCVAANESLEADGRRGRKGRPNLEGSVERVERRGAGVKTEEPVLEGEVNGERRKSTRVSGVGEVGGAEEGASLVGDGDTGLRRRSKGGGAAGAEADDVRKEEEVREAKVERKGRLSRGHEGPVAEVKGEVKEVKESKEGKDVRDVREEARKGKRKSESGEAKVEKGGNGDEAEVKEEMTEEQKQEASQKDPDRREEKRDGVHDRDKNEEKHDRKGKKGKKDRRDDKEREHEARGDDAAESERLVVEVEKHDKHDKHDRISKGPEKGGDKSVQKANDKNKNGPDNEQSAMPRAGDKDEDSEGALQARTKDKDKDKDKDVKEKKRSSKGSSELAALQADVSNSDMLSSFAESGKRRSTPATYFTYDEGGNQSEVTTSKEALKGTHPPQKSPDKLEGRGKTRELAGLGVEPTRPGRRAVLEALKEPQRRERQQPDRYDAMPMPKLKKVKKEDEDKNTKQAVQSTSPAANGSASQEGKAKDGCADGHDGVDTEHGGRSRLGKKHATRKEEDEDVAMEEDANEPRAVGARSTRKRGNKLDDDLGEADAEVESAVGPSKKKGKVGKKDKRADLAAEEQLVEAPEESEAGDGPAASRRRAVLWRQQGGVGQEGTRDSELDDAPEQKLAAEDGEGEEGEEASFKDGRTPEKAPEKTFGDTGEDEESDEDEGVGIVELRDDDVIADPLWPLEDRNNVGDDDAVKGFLLEALRQACSNFLLQREYKGVAYFLHAGGSETQRALSSVDIAQGFRGRSTHNECADFLRTFATEKQAMAAVIVVEDRLVRYPRVRSHVARSARQVEGADAAQVAQRGLVLQLEADDQRRVWHVIYQQRPAETNTDDGNVAEGKEEGREENREKTTSGLVRTLSLRELDVRKCGIMVSIIPAGMGGGGVSTTATDT